MFPTPVPQFQPKFVFEKTKMEIFFLGFRRVLGLDLVLFMLEIGHGFFLGGQIQNRYAICSSR